MAALCQLAQTQDISSPVIFLGVGRSTFDWHGRSRTSLGGHPDDKDCRGTQVTSLGHKHFGYFIGSSPLCLLPSLCPDRGAVGKAGKILVNLGWLRFTGNIREPASRSARSTADRQKNP